MYLAIMNANTGIKLKLKSGFKSKLRLSLVLKSI